MEQSHEAAVTQSEYNQEEEAIDHLKSGSPGAPSLENDSTGNNFNCNICLDLVQDPVVTCCGHLYCWPCIYKWIRSQTASCEDPYHQPRCPVCNVDVSVNTLIPLYGRGHQSRKSSNCKGVPQRPNGPGCGVLNLTSATRSSHHHHHHHGYHLDQQMHPSSSTFGLAGTTTYHWMIGMLGDIIHAWTFRNSQRSLYTYPNTYSVASTGNARLRRHEMLVDRSLSRVCFFLCCCVIVCLLLF